MKVKILFEFREGAFGGGNQFLKALKKYFESAGIYEEDIGRCDTIIFNSFQSVNDVISAKKRFPEKVYIHRVDGPIRLYNKMDDRRDFVVNVINRFIADGTVFQSKWSYTQNLRLGFEQNGLERVIMNAPDPELFNRNNKSDFSRNRKIRLISSSWSSNLKKGFDVYEWLDRNLDFTKFDMFFFGRSPICFKNIICIQPLRSAELAIELKKSDIFIIGSQKDPCSNSLLEGLNCGLPAVYLNDGGHPEIVGNAGEPFNKAEEIPAILDKIINNYTFYQNNIRPLKLDDVGRQYYRFCEDLSLAISDNRIKQKRLSFAEYWKIKKEVWHLKISEKKLICI